MKDSNETWLPNFDAYKSGANHHYVEGNAWQLTYFVPQDVPALAEAIGEKRFIERLDWGFTESEKTRFNGLNDQYWDYPVMQGISSQCILLSCLIGLKNHGLLKNGVVQYWTVIMDMVFRTPIWGTKTKVK